MNKHIIRAKSIITEKWLQGYYYEYLDEEFIMSGRQVYPVKPETIGRYIGKVDKFGREIFEGDIVRFYGYDNKPEYCNDCVIVFEDRFAQYMGVTLDSISEKAKKYDDFEWNTSETVEILGNIHDNPELLPETVREQLSEQDEITHAKWNVCSDGYYPYCSNCSFEPARGESLPEYCPDCGAVMDLEDSGTLR